MNIHSVYKQLVVNPAEKDVPITENDGIFIYNFLKKKHITKTLEIGFGYGFSAVYIICATKNKHYVIDPEESSFNNFGIDNIKRMKLEKYLLHIDDYSHNALPRLLSEGKKFDFAFIDGNHRFDTMFIDFYYIDLLLNHAGFVLFHDSWMKSTQHVISWIQQNKCNYKIINTSDKNIILAQKIGTDDREWYHFNEFCISDRNVIQKIIKSTQNFLIKKCRI